MYMEIIAATQQVTMSIVCTAVDVHVQGVYNNNTVYIDTDRPLPLAFESGHCQRSRKAFCWDDLLHVCIYVHGSLIGLLHKHNISIHELTYRHACTCKC